MTIATQSRTAGPFECNGSTTVYPFTFKVFTTSDVAVVFRNTASGEETKLVLNIDYSVALNVNQNANPGGSITIIGPAYAAGNALTLTSELQYLQPTDLTNQGGFYPRVISDALDRLTIFTQQIRGLATRALKFPISDGNLDATIPGKDQRKGRILAFDAATGLPVVGPFVDGIGAGANYIGETAPTSGLYVGFRWYNPSQPASYVYYVDGDSGQWVEEASQGIDGALRDDLAASNSSALVGGVTAGNLARKYSEFVSINDFGTLGTGNDKVIFQSAANACKLGKTLWLGNATIELGTLSAGEIGVLIDSPVNMQIIGSGATIRCTAVVGRSSMIGLKNPINFKSSGVNF